MSSQALARKYRPQDFDTVVGQETAVQILANALASRRIHHAYLFTGPRGIGKTSIARIFAKALNCERDDHPTPKPCNECVSCREITDGRSLSVLEIDGASNTSVEDVRDLRDKIRYLPPGGRYKIYIIDEVHMLSTAAFNALLKTLEEPPSHAIFIFATTDPQKVPATVVSRVIRLDLRPISRAGIAAQLRKVSTSESIAITDAALFQIAQEAEGGLRDALSLLDQIISYSRTGSSAEIGIKEVEEVVGVSTHRFVKDLGKSMVRRDSANILKVAETAFASGVDAKRLSLDLLEFLRHLLVAQVSSEPSLFDLPPDEIQELAALAREVSTPDLDRIFRMAQKGVVDLLRSPLPKVLLDVLLLRLTQWEDLKSLDEILAMLKLGSAPTPVRVEAPARAPAPNPVPARPVVPAPLPPPPPPAPVASSPKPVVPAGATWPEFLSFLKNKSVRLAALVEQGRLVSLGDLEVVLQYPPKSMNLEFLKDPERSESLGQSLKEFFHRPLTIRLETAGTGASANTGKVAGTIVDDAISIFAPKNVIAPKRGDA